ncbi:3-phosphoshikimate 1-carboxyvinyltransferase [Alienimonas chondri]|uniref:3-phosphoshikimate 1-carboxyvinyltransferase n=1 Tax=Alienimonas chondri TaxID=2681879 RepID=A0ABX1VKF6_9PLAN|nr:3-phosphoshikimate 1-carboxyvinyltransferase [Alienimonas chondri]NNJ27668.1 3-phosphoshikimate 1-carboxyvinyltransferase [Alienimonas chondri]
MLDSLPDPLPITPVDGPLRGVVRPPGSKSLTNRALAVAALAEGTSHLTGVLDSDDTRVMLRALQTLGLAVEHDPDAATVSVTGCGGVLPATEADLFCENSGTSIRFLTALIAAAGRGTYRLDGVARMRERPIGDLADALNALGANVTCDLGTGCPPLTVKTGGLNGGVATVESGASSQFLSALLMAAPAAREPVALRVPGELVSVPYVRMTRGVLETFGVDLIEADSTFCLSPQTPAATDYAVEPDASAASYWFAAAAITGGRITVEGLGADSVQGDMDFLWVLEAMGCEVTIEEDSATVTGPTGGRLKGGQTFDMGPISDTAQTAAAVAVFADGPTTVTGIAHARHKETDRVAAVVTELRKLGQTCEEHADGFTIYPAPVTPATVHTYDDHRMAMSFALIGLRAPGVQIADPGCVAKTYPRFWEDFERLSRTHASGLGAGDEEVTS